MVRSTKGYAGTLNEEFDFLNDHVKPRMERINGIASVNIYGGKERELQVITDSDALASRRITVP